LVRRILPSTPTLSSVDLWFFSE